MPHTLNKEKPYGTIHHSEDHDGSHFEQDGIIFDASGKEWVAPPKRPAPAVAAVTQDTTFAEAVEDAVAAALAPVLAKLKLLEDAANGGDSAPPKEAEKPKPVVKPAGVDKNLAG